LLNIQTHLGFNLLINGKERGWAAIASVKNTEKTTSKPFWCQETKRIKLGKYEFSRF